LTMVSSTLKAPYLSMPFVTQIGLATQMTNNQLLVSVYFLDPT
jgi:hypothetical protein